MSNNTYNGWANYPTWAVNLWLSNDQSTQEYVDGMAMEAMRNSEGNIEDASLDLAESLKDMVEQDCDELNQVSGMYSDLLTWAMHMADYDEIAEHWVQDVEYEPEDEEEAN